MNYYELLQVREDASDEVIKMAYKALVKKYHPDTYEGDKAFAEMKMKEINIAYSTLSDTTKRAEYDFFLRQQDAPKEQPISNITEQYKSEKSKKTINLKAKWVAIAVTIVVLFGGIFAFLSLKGNSIEMVKDSVVMIRVFDEKDDEIATGSGFCAFESNCIITNYHVIEGASKITIITDDGLEHILNTVSVFNKAQDMAILKGNFALKPIDIGNGNELKAGDKVTAIGSPEGEKNTVSTGVISNADDDYQIRITAPISPGSSGGVLLNEKNKVVGITYATYDSENAQNLNYAINVNCLKTMHDAYLDKEYTAINIDNYESHIDELWKKENTVYYNVASIKMFEEFTNPFYKIEKALEVPERDALNPINGFDELGEVFYERRWGTMFDELPYSKKMLVAEIYNELSSTDFDNGNVAKDVNTWTPSEFFINLNILDKARYAVVAVVIVESEENDVWDSIDELPVDYEIKLLLADLLGGYDWEHFSDEDKEIIFCFFDEYYWKDIVDMGAVLAYLGYEIEYSAGDSIFAHW